MSRVGRDAHPRHHPGKRPAEVFAELEAVALLPVPDPYDQPHAPDSRSGRTARIKRIRVA